MTDDEDDKFEFPWVLAILAAVTGIMWVWINWWALLIPATVIVTCIAFWCYMFREFRF